LAREFPRPPLSRPAFPLQVPEPQRYLVHHCGLYANRLWRPWQGRLSGPGRGANSVDPVPPSGGPPNTHLPRCPAHRPAMVSEARSRFPGRGRTREDALYNPLSATQDRQVVGILIGAAFWDV
jgi:hypothetical protein